MTEMFYVDIVYKEKMSKGTILIYAIFQETSLAKH